MLILWGVIWGAFFGGLLGHNDSFGAIVGGFFGFFAGLSLHLIIKSKLKGAVADAQLALAAAWEAEEARKQKVARQAAQSPTPAVLLNTSLNASSSEQRPAAAMAKPAATFDAQAASIKPDFMVPSAQAATPQAVKLRPAPATQTYPMPPRESSAIELGIIAAKNWLFGGNTVVRIGIVVLFLGLLFLAKFAVDNALIPIEVRLAAIGLAGVALLMFGWRTRATKPGYALTLQGAGVAVLYLTTFAAFKLYHLLDPGFAFAVMGVVCALSTTLALLQNSRAMAVIGFTGGFLVPVLLSTGGGSHIALFSYYVLLNVAVLVIAWFKTWRLLSVVSFVLTFGIAGLWARDHYESVHYASCQAFLIIGWVIYLAIALIYANRSAVVADIRGAGYVDGTLIFGMALVGFGMQAAMVRATPYASAFAAVMVGGVYLGLAWWQAYRDQRAQPVQHNGASHETTSTATRLGGESMLAIGVGFATLAIPLAFGAEVTAAAWAIEGAAIVWVGLRQHRWLARAFGLALQPVALITFLLGISGDAWEPATPVTQFFLNTQFMGMLLLAAGAVVIAWVLRWETNEQPNNQNGEADHADTTSSLQRGYEVLERWLAAPAVWYGFVLWCTGLSNEVTRYLPSVSVATSGDVLHADFYHTLVSESHQLLAIMMIILLSAVASFIVGRRLAWKAARAMAFIALPLLAWFAALSTIDMNAGFNRIGFIVWPMALAIHYWLMYANDDSAREHAVPGKWYAMAHAVSVWIMVVLAGGALAHLVSNADLWRTAWASVTLVVAAVIALALLIVWVTVSTNRASVTIATTATTADTLAEDEPKLNAVWPLRPYLRSYIFIAAIPLVMGTALGGFALALLSNGNAAPLPYIPLLNPVEITVALTIAVGVAWVLLMRRLGFARDDSTLLGSRHIWIPYATLSFVFINTVWLRIAHHFFAVPWDSDQLFNSFFVQTGYSILWSVMGLVMMVMGHRKARRGLWMLGAALLGLTVAKLFFIDISNVGGITRVVAFIGVAVLILIAGFFAPIPPAAPKPLVPPVDDQDSEQNLENKS